MGLEFGVYSRANGADNDYRGLGLHDERAPDGRNLDFLHELQKAGDFYEASMNSPSVGTKCAFPAWFPEFWVNGIVSGNINKKQSKV